MGANISRKELQSLTPENIADGVRSWGVAYEVYSKDIIENGMSGDVLLSMSDTSEVIDSFGITNKLHIAKIKSVLTVWKQETDAPMTEIQIDGGPNIEVC
jgi:hypothetical protein